MEEVRSFKSCLIILLIISSFLLTSPLAQDNSFEIADLTYNGTRANNNVNYTQLCLDFIQEHYTNNTVYLILSDDETTEETGAIYTIIKANWTLEDGGIESVTVSINHDTHYIEEGKSQKKRDYLEYIDSLPYPYQKTHWDTRKKIIEEFGYLPSIEDVEGTRWFCSSTQIYIYYSNFSSFAQKLNSSRHYWFNDNVMEGTGKIMIHIRELKFSEFLTIINETYTNQGVFSYDGILYEKPSTLIINPLLVAVVVCVIIYLIIHYRVKVKKGLP